jgi:hypothetical protein
MASARLLGSPRGWPLSGLAIAARRPACGGSGGTAKGVKPVVCPKALAWLNREGGSDVIPHQNRNAQRKSPARRAELRAGR